MTTFTQSDAEHGLAHFPVKLDLTPRVMFGVSNSKLSIARHYGACTYNGAAYTYAEEADALVRNDVLAWLVKERKKRGKKA